MHIPYGKAYSVLAIFSFLVITKEVLVKRLNTLADLVNQATVFLVYVDSDNAAKRGAQVSPMLNKINESINKLAEDVPNSPANLCDSNTDADDIKKAFNEIVDDFDFTFGTLAGKSALLKESHGGDIKKSLESLKDSFPPLSNAVQGILDCRKDEVKKGGNQFDDQIKKVIDMYK